MENELELNDGNGIRQYFDTINALSCVKFLIISELVLQIIKILSIAFVLFYTKDHSVDQNIRIFLYVYGFLTLFKAITFYQKNSSFFEIRRIPDYDENPRACSINGVLEGILIVWYIVGFVWLRECTNCKADQPLIYYSVVICVALGFFNFIAPVFAILILCLLISYTRPKLQTVIFGEENLPDDNNKCTICYDDYISGNRVKVLPCEHHFHNECIEEWFSVKDSCPLCKQNINTLHECVDFEAHDM